MERGRWKRLLPALAVLTAVGAFVGFSACRPMTPDRNPPAEEAENPPAKKSYISGRVVTHAGDPVPEFEITVWAPWEIKLFPIEPIRFVNAAGRFLLEAPEGGHCDLHASAALGTARVSVDLSDGKAPEEVLIALVPRYAIEGRVLAASSRAPIAGARVAWTQSGYWDVMISLDQDEEDDGGLVLTAPDGSFRLEKVADEAQCIYVKSQGFQPEIVTPIPLADSYGVARLDVVLSRPAVVTGYAVRPQGPSAFVELRRGFSDMIACSGVEEDGFYSITAAPGTYTIGISQSESDLFFARDITIAEGETVRLDLLEEEPGAARIRGRGMRPVDSNSLASVREGTASSRTGHPWTSRWGRERTSRPTWSRPPGGSPFASSPRPVGPFSQRSSWRPLTRAPSPNGCGRAGPDGPMRAARPSFTTCLRAPSRSSRGTRSVLAVPRGTTFRGARKPWSPRRVSRRSNSASWREHPPSKCTSLALAASPCPELPFCSWTRTGSASKGIGGRVWMAPSGSKASDGDPTSPVRPPRGTALFVTRRSWWDPAGTSPRSA